HTVHPITAVQTEYSLWTRDIEADILPLLRELGIGLVAYAPLGHGFLTGAYRNPQNLAEGDRRRSQPRLAEQNIATTCSQLTGPSNSQPRKASPQPSPQSHGYCTRATTSRPSPAPNTCNTWSRTWPRTTSA